MNKPLIFSQTPQQLNDCLINNGYSGYKTKQIYQWLYQKEICDINQMSDLAKGFREFLQDKYMFNSLQVVKQQKSVDGSLKILFSCVDGALVETVIMRHHYGNSVCVSSQVGCLMGCTFCASGLLKKQRDLSAGEMVLQVALAKQLIGERISNVVVMGSGEPFDNYQQVIDFLTIINNDNGLAIGARHITVSTCGIVPKILLFKEEKPYNLAISLHAANDELRSKLMPVNEKYPLKMLQDALISYQLVKNRRLSIEYILFSGVNDKIEDADDLARFVKPLTCAYINLIPYNNIDEFDLQGVDDFAALRFYDLLKKRNIAVTIRSKHGDDIAAACGQLRNKYIEE